MRSNDVVPICPSFTSEGAALRRHATALQCNSATALQRYNATALRRCDAAMSGVQRTAGGVQRTAGGVQRTEWDASWSGRVGPRSDTGSIIGSLSAQELSQPAASH